MNILFEIKLVILISALLLISTPKYIFQNHHNIYDKIIIDNLINTISTARQYAIATNQVITAIPDKQNIIIKNNNKIYINKKILLKPDDNLEFKFFRNNYLEFLPNGTTNSTNGKIIFNKKHCLIINKFGRLKYVKNN